MDPFPTDPDAPREADFPREGAPGAQARALLDWAVRAPSSHNSQPWRFRLDGEGGIELFADRTRALPVVDPEDRELTISCGAALGHLEDAARGFGLRATVTPEAPGPGEDRLARIAVVSDAPPEAAERARLAAIPARRTNRGPYAAEPLPDGLADQMAEQAAAFGVSLRAAGAEAREAAAELAAEGDRRQFADPAFRRELAAWVHSWRLGSRDGMTSAGFGVPDVLAPAARLALRSFDMGGGVAAADAARIREGAPGLWLLATPGDAAPDWLATGRALSRLTLELTARGLSASYLNPPVERAELRPQLAEAFGTRDRPQLLLRIGRATEPAPATPRRPVSELLLD
jgi:nitroreductase